MDVIHLLPDSVANQIAAGEVIQRPASVIKELVENAIDAGASTVDIVVKDAGRTLIQVIDDGCGMSVTDARMAFERHATSKISKADDLFSLHTMGFRGEALPSVAAVSEIELRTRRANDVTGTRLIISASNVESQDPDVCSAGTNIMVKRLFFNLPARRKFLKKDAVEMGHIAREFERLALVNTNVALSLRNGDQLIHKLPPASLKQRIADLFGKGYDHQLIPVSTETSLVTINGFVALPQYAKKRGYLQYFFVNGRNMRHLYFHKAVTSCYDQLISPDTQPTYFINFEVDPETIDVNIHPQKHEIKFENEQPIWQILTAAIKEALGRFNASSAIDFDTVDAPDIPPFQPSDTPDMPTIDIDPHYNPFKDYSSNASSARGSAPSAHNRPVSTNNTPTDWEKLYEGFSKRADMEQQTVPSRLNDDSIDAAPLPLSDDAGDQKPMLQLKRRYIVTPSKSGLMLINQRRAHIRILYDKYIEMAQKGEVQSQRLIFPESVSLDPQQDIIAASICDMLCNMGFDVSNLGGRDWSINAVPSIMSSSSPSSAFINILDAVQDEDEDVRQSQWHRIALSMAKSAAVKYGDALTTNEMESIISDLFRLPSPDYTPDGKPVIQIIDIEEINKKF